MHHSFGGGWKQCRFSHLIPTALTISNQFTSYLKLLLLPEIKYGERFLPVGEKKLCAWQPSAHWQSPVNKYRLFPSFQTMMTVGLTISVIMTTWTHDVKTIDSTFKCNTREQSGEMLRCCFSSFMSTSKQMELSYLSQRRHEFIFDFIRIGNKVMAFQLDY